MQPLGALTKMGGICRFLGRMVLPCPLIEGGGFPKKVGDGNIQCYFSNPIAHTPLSGICDGVLRIGGRLPAGSR